MMTLLLTRWRVILPIIIIVAMSLTILYYKTRHERTVQDLTDLKSELLASQKAGELLQKASAIQLASVMANHEDQLKQANLDREKITTKLKGTINEIRNSLAVANNANGLRNENSHNALLKIPANTEGTTESERDCHTFLATVIDAGKITDYDYEALYNAWQRQCDLGLCE
jgi:hypothetical protein